MMYRIRTDDLIVYADTEAEAFEKANEILNQDFQNVAPLKMHVAETNEVTLVA